MSLDLADLYNLVEPQERGADLVIAHPVTGERMADIAMTIAGPDSNVQRRARQRLNDDLLALRRRPTAEENENLVTEMLARCVVGWNVKQDGAEVPFSFANVLRVLNRFTFIREQVDLFAGSRAAYLQKSEPAAEQSAGETEGSAQ